ncbi:MAG: LysR substrate-binding domain-containing protein [Desulfuromonas sp.]
MALTLRKLEIFCQVADCGQVTRAAEALLLGQSAISMALAELEQQAGGPLFLRQGRRLLLNDRGRLLLEPARQIVQAAAAFDQLLSESGAQPRGLLRIGASTTIGNYLLPALLADFSRRYPAASASLLVGNTRQVERALERGRIDLGLIEGPSHAPLLQTRPWRDDVLVVIAAPQHPLAHPGAPAATALAAADWILREAGSGTREVCEAALLPWLGSWRPYLELGHTEAIKKAVEAGMGVSCLSRLAVQRELQLGFLVELAVPVDLRRPLTLLLPRQHPATRLLQAFIELLDETAGAKG